MSATYWIQRTHLFRADEYIYLPCRQQKTLQTVSKLRGNDEERPI